MTDVPFSFSDIAFVVMATVLSLIFNTVFSNTGCFYYIMLSIVRNCMLNLGILYAIFVQFGPKLVIVTIAIGTEIKISENEHMYSRCFFISSAVLSF